MFEDTNESVSESTIDSSVEYGNTEYQSAVDLIEAVEAPVKTVADVKKTRATSLATVVNTLKGITTKDLENSTLVVIRELLAEATRITNVYKDLVG